MSRLSNDQGRAFEYAILNSLKKEIAASNSVKISVIKDSAYEATKNAWDRVDASVKCFLENSAESTVCVLKDVEPIIFESGKDEIQLRIQTDQAGTEGDVRDILITREQYDWEIGLSVKHNHAAVKHSRLSRTIDFTEKWFGIKCSEPYWDAVYPIFDLLEHEKSSGTKWSELDRKYDDVYIPLLNAFVDEIRRSYKTNGEAVPRRMAQYLLGIYDFYKVIGKDRQRKVEIHCFNIRGNLNKGAQSFKPCVFVKKTKLPDRLVCIEVKPKSKTTVEMYLNNGWQFEFRIHNASTKVEPSLKFDINLIGKPNTIMLISKDWIKRER